MKLITTLIFYSAMFFQLNAQNVVSGIRGPCSQTIPQYIYPINGILFYPKTQTENRPDSLYNFCDNIRKRIFFLDGLEMSEDIFLKLNLKQKYVTNKGAWYIYQYKKQDTTNCVESTSLFLSINIPIKLNGVELNPYEKETVLKKIQSGQLVAINSKRNIFGKATIEIITR
jgi:hypothetical protein